MKRNTGQRSCYKRTYHIFEEGDEVYTDKRHFKSVTAWKPYIVLKCYRPGGYVADFPVVVIDIMSDKGFISTYATDRFIKTERQIRDDKIQEILG